MKTQAKAFIVNIDLKMKWVILFMQMTKKHIYLCGNAFSFFYYPLRFIFLPHYSRNTKSSQKQGCKLKYDLYFFTFINLLIFKLIQYCSLVFEFFLQVHDHLHDHPASLQRFLNDTHLG